MVLKTRKPKRAPPEPEQPIVWERADPAALANFDPSTKTCTMNCGKHAHDPRSYKELKFMCDDCDCHEPKGCPSMPLQPITSVDEYRAVLDVVVKAEAEGNEVLARPLRALVDVSPFDGCWCNGRSTRPLEPACPICAGEGFVPSSACDSRYP